MEHRHSFLKAKFPDNPDWKQIALGGVHLNALLKTIRHEIASLMRWYPNRDEEEEVDDCLPTTGAKRKKSGRWLMKRMPWELDVEEKDKTRYGTDPPRNASDVSYRHVMHSCFGHQSWALHTLVVAMVAYQIAYIQIVHTHAQVCMCMHI